MRKGKIVKAPQDEEFQRIIRQLQAARTKTKISRETCPRCGAKLVNLYRKSIEDSVWMCRKCWVKHELGKIVEVDSNG